MPRRDFTKVPFAATGDTTSIPTASQPDGTISLATGWGYDYERDNGAGGGTPDPLAKNIGRAQMNGILNEITASLGEIQLNGYPLWSASAVPYPINAVVRYGTKNFISLIDNNSTTPVAGANWAEFSAAGGKLMGVNMITSNTTYVPTPGTKFVIVEVVGGGGGGGGCSATASGQYAASAGGGGGSYAKSLYTVAQIGSGQAVVIGAAGLGGTAQGGQGGSTTFGSLISAPGGGAGGACIPIPTTMPNSTVPGPANPAATGGNILNCSGIPGQPGILSPYTVTVGGAGGGSPMFNGGGGAIQAATSSPSGINATSPGGGGSGCVTGAAGASSPAKTGGNGMAGAVLVWEYV